MVIKGRITKIFFGKSEKVFIFAVPILGSHIGEMLEWLKRHAWKACILQKGIPSSNLGLSANQHSQPAAQQLAVLVVRVLESLLS